jgi:4-diphosphocytidyl-2-C-methyl-D-erythritol kinase
VHEAIVEPAPAKLNLFLRVLGRRDDGYHDIETLILPLSLADGVTVETSPNDRFVSVMTFGPGAEGVPKGEDNLAVAAAAGLMEALGREDGVQISIDKRVPVAAGLGGGSADAAATLRALGLLWSSEAFAMRRVAAAVGSDVPALLHGGPALARGRGELVEPVDVPRLDWVLLHQPFGVSAESAYRWWDEGSGRTGPALGPVIDAARAADVDALSSLLFNDLERPVAGRHPEAIEATRVLLEAGAVGAIMCGSGPTVAGLCRDGEQAAEVASATRGMAVNTLVRPQE